MKPITQLIQTLGHKLHLNVVRSPRDGMLAASLPLALKKSYAVDVVMIEGIEVAVLSVDELNTSGLQKHLELYDRALALPLLLNITEGNSSLQKFLIDKNIAFVMGEDTVYMPQFLIWIKDLSGKADFRPISHKKLSKLAQMVMIDTLLHKKNDLDISSVSKTFGVSAMSASRVLNEMAAHKLFVVEKMGREKSYRLSHPIEIDKVLSLMASPKRSEVFVKRSELSRIEGLMETSFHALSSYSDLASMRNEYALDKSRLDQSIETYDRAYDNEYVKIELWKYDPRVLVQNHSTVVDPVSLYLSLKEESRALDDVRVQNAIENLYNKIKEVCGD
jgi:hypothetical protein